jgi:ureidoacrylate peracid hydrolase
MKLNGATISDEIVRRVVARRGTEHCFAELDPKRTALVVIDLQHAFMNDAVGHAVVPAARDIVPAVNRLAAVVRHSGGGVFWVQMTHDDNCLDDWSVAFDMSTPAMREKRISALSEGGLGHQLWPDLDVKPEDEIVKKYRYSGFLPGTSDLADRLRARLRHGADHRHGDQCLLRKFGAGR